MGSVSNREEGATGRPLIEALIGKLGKQINLVQDSIGRIPATSRSQFSARSSFYNRTMARRDTVTQPDKPRCAALRISAVFLSSLLIACASTDSTISAQLDDDGMMRIYQTSRGELWLRPDTHFASYDKLLIEPLTVSYHARGHFDYPGLRETDFQFDAIELARVEDRFNKAITEVWMSKEDRSMARKPGPDVLIMTPSITDLFLYASIKDVRLARDRSMVRESSKMVIRAELRDGESGQLLARIADRRITGSRNLPARPMNRVTYFSDVYLEFRSWANRHIAHME